MHLWLILVKFHFWRHAWNVPEVAFKTTNSVRIVYCLLQRDITAKKIRMWSLFLTMLLTLMDWDYLVQLTWRLFQITAAETLVKVIKAPMMWKLTFYSHCSILGRAHMAIWVKPLCLFKILLVVVFIIILHLYFMFCVLML